MRRLVEHFVAGRMQGSLMNGSSMTLSIVLTTGKLLRIGVTRVAMTSGSNLEISVDRLGKDVVVRPSGHIDVDSSPALRDRLIEVLSEVPNQVVTVDLTGVTYIEASGIATLMEALRTARRHQTTFCLRGLNGSVLRLFEVTGVLALFESSDRKQKAS
jgi:anti-sigma B factor antagonist